MAASAVQQQTARVLLHGSVFCKVRKAAYQLFAHGVGVLSALLARLLLPTEVKNLQRRIHGLTLLSPLDVNLTQALIAGEDHRFLFHRGVDPIGIARATIRTLGGRLEGASTLEQQLVRSLLRDYRISFRRKAREALIATTLADRFSKAEILSAYLSVAHFGQGIYGIQDATLKIQTPTSIQNHACAYLISHLKYPRHATSDEQCDRRRISRTLRISRRLETANDWILNH
ncbi:transglycosylase domain-containing protein [Limnohabitans sp. Jir61]|uniref:transglycosylase domain-containing protein n=1 Tax=Limnohabitans sp. Jir61 TaxID=1826168 RepID=UPI0013048CC5|nr:biosynthetic peptidoglycan transglycosylase [Limnohabitans sp. Jir61]